MEYWMFSSFFYLSNKWILYEIFVIHTQFRKISLKDLSKIFSIMISDLRFVSLESKKS